MRRSIPNYELYGELLAGGLPGPVHHETIEERSSKHNWTIRLHRHRRLAQIFLFSSPEVFLRMGDIEHTSNDNILLVVPPGVPHGFKFSEDVVGDVVSIRLDEMPPAIQQRLELFSAEVGAIFTEQDTESFENVVVLMSQLREAYHSVSLNKIDVLNALVDLITVYLSGDLKTRSSLRPAPSNPQQGRRGMQAETFCSLLEENFQQAWSVADYADKVGISAPHLTRICRSELGAAPNDLVRQRRMLEAKRLLEYTALSVAEIAHRCGFRDAAFFSRSFKSSFQVSPKWYRKQFD